jgi:hypothetical protein
MTPALTADGQLNRDVVEGWYVGTNGVIPWSAWIVPLLAWASVILALHFMLGCLGVMLRAQWAEREALAFPLLRLPTDLTEDVDRGDKYAVFGRFFRNPAMWVGFGIAVFIEALNGLNLYFPDVPRVPLNINMGQVLSEAPWNQIGGIEVRVFPTVVGITYLLTSEVSLSLWFFYLFTKLQLIVAYYIGFMPSAIPDQFWTRGWAKGFIGYQQFGAYFAYVGTCAVDRSRAFRPYRAPRLWTCRTICIGKERSAFLSRGVLGLPCVFCLCDCVDSGRGCQHDAGHSDVADLSGGRTGIDARCG